jgi:Ca2+-dependent lipid-binding protein
MLRRQLQARGGAAPFVALSFGTCFGYTKCVDCTLNPVWHEAVPLWPLRGAPPSVRLLNVQILDSDVGLSNDNSLGSTEIELPPLDTASVAMFDMPLVGCEGTVRLLVSVAPLQPDGTGACPRATALQAAYLYPCGHCTYRTLHRSAHTT